MIFDDRVRTRDGPTPAVAQAALDRILELFERRELSATELRVLLALVDREAGLPDLAAALHLRPDEISRAGRRLSMRGLLRWYHVGRHTETRLAITSSGLTTVRALLTAAGAERQSSQAANGSATPGTAPNAVATAVETTATGT